MDQCLSFESAIDTETFAREKCTIFLIVPEEDTTKHSMVGLTIQNLSRELFDLADRYSRKLENRLIFFFDELAIMPLFDILLLFATGRSRKLIVGPTSQSMA